MPGKLLPENQLLSILSTSSNATAIYSNRDLTISFVNDAMLTIYGKDRSVVGKTLLQALPELAGQPFIAILQNVWDSGRTYTAQDTSADLVINGVLETRFFDFEYRPMFDQDGNVYAILHTTIDVTDKMEALRLVREKEERELALNEELVSSNEELTALNEEYQATNEDLRSAYLKLENLHRDLAITEQKAKLLLEGAPVAIGIIDAESYTVDSANDKLLQLWGTTRSAIGKELIEFLPQNEANIFVRLIETIKSEGKTVYGDDVKRLLANGEEINTTYFNFVYQPIKDIDNKVISIQVVANEVTDQRVAKLEADAALEQLNLASRAAKMGMFDLDIPNDRMEWDRRCRELFGLSDTDAITYSKTFVEGLHPDDREAIVAAVDRAYDLVRSGGRYEVEYRTLSPEDGRIRWVHAVGQVYFNEENEPVRFIGMVTDITELVEARQLMAQKEEALQQLNEELSASNEEITAINEEYQAANEELTVTNEKLQKTEEDLRVLYDKLIISETMFKELFNQAPLGLALLRGEDMVIEQVNDVMLRIWDRTAAEVMDKPHTEARPEIADQIVPTLLQEVYRSGKIKVNTELRVNLKDGDGLREAFVNSIYSPITDKAGVVTGVLIMLDEVTEIIAERKQRERVEELFRMTIESADMGTWYMDGSSRKLVSGTGVKKLFGFGSDEEMTFEQAVSQVHEDHRENVINAVNASIETGETYDIEYPVIGRNDGQLRYIKAFGRYFPASEKGGHHLSGVVLDITERKQDEQRKDDFIGIVSHELRSPLTSMNGYVQMLKLRGQKSEDAMITDIATKAKRQVDRMSALITGFLDVARISEGKIHLNKQPFDMAKLVKLVEDEVMATVTSHNVVFHPVEYTPVYADHNKIEQVVVNFINNAVKYSPENNTINIACVTLDGKAFISVSDEGMGIPEKDLPHIFDRFYRVDSNATKTINGFGIGLYICKEIIQRHDGKIGVNSVAGKGSMFWFDLPVVIE